MGETAARELLLTGRLRDANDLVAAAMDREERACVGLFGRTDAREALRAFAARGR